MARSVQRRSGGMRTLGSLAQVEILEGPAQIKREMARRRLVVGGLMSSPFLTLVVLPVLYQYFDDQPPVFETPPELLTEAAPH
jgi:Cu/Ag efflux pump CusA